MKLLDFLAVEIDQQDRTWVQFWMTNEWRARSDFGLAGTLLRCSQHQSREWQSSIDEAEHSTILDQENRKALSWQSLDTLAICFQIT